MTYSSEYLRAAPRSVAIKPDACLFSEAYFLLFLSEASIRGINVQVCEEQVNYNRRSKVKANVITKTGIERIGFPTSLVLSCADKPILEGMITDQAPERKVIRPFCNAADYSKRPKVNRIVSIDNELIEMRRKLNIKDVTAVGMLTSLLEIVGLTDKLGVKFFENILYYTNYVYAHNLQVGYWSEIEPIKSISTGAYPEL